MLNISQELLCSITLFQQCLGLVCASYVQQMVDHIHQLWRCWQKQLSAQYIGVTKDPIGDRNSSGYQAEVGIVIAVFQGSEGLASDWSCMAALALQWQRSHRTSAETRALDLYVLPLL